ncbi:KEOPS complex subunit Cgi121 [Methanolobus profundi]|uniref:KEOPS complex subunit Cgi121 n=1 Tax=Methanolobus profundi TaxID=487685 RepID=A0A1I4U941_9EURY|nr:KEOPS complex subunit Cgi121 [Methanolobus profundi]SFM85526.1 KEOPS complex subunit Cgi121 [Methanolobus profundi]
MEFMIIGGSLYVESVPELLSRLRSISSLYNTTIQAMDADRIAGEEHVLFAIRKALRAIENGSNMARDMGIEIMRYAAGKKQIEEAFSMGVHEGDMDIVFVVLGEEKEVKDSVMALKDIIAETSVLDYSDTKRDIILEQFLISDKEIQAVGEDMIPSIVLERVALVDVLK